MRITRYLAVITFVIILFSNLCAANDRHKVSTFQQEFREFYFVDNEKPEKIFEIEIDTKGNVYSASENIISVFKEGIWETILDDKKIKAIYLSSFADKMAALICSEETPLKSIFIFSDGMLKKKLLISDEKITQNEITAFQISKQNIIIGIANKLFFADYPTKNKNIQYTSVSIECGSINEIATKSNSAIYIAAQKGLFQLNTKTSKINNLFPSDGNYSFAPVNVMSISVNEQDDLWFASPQGTGYFDKEWRLFTGREGLPYNKFTSMTTGKGKEAWFGTIKGAIHYDGKDWAYRQGKRWLPDDKVNDIEIAKNGDAWIATNNGISVIRFKDMTFAKKAQWYENEIDKYNRRTPYGFVLEASLPDPGIKKNVRKHDSDNDGLWTAMYGAGECFAYAATKDKKARERATKAFEALRFLGQVTQGGEAPAPKGFVARTILPVSGKNPNDGRIERDIRNKQEDDKMWKVIDPRWPIDESKKWYWKTDASSDELDGHYFLYGLYYDLVAKSDMEKERVREVVSNLTDHLIEHNFNLVDHDGKPTRWSRFSPDELNFSKEWTIERGLNSLSMLSYLAVAEHVTGDSKYSKIKEMLIKKHSYHQNLMNPKYQHGIGTGNQSDDEMAFMGYYHLIKYEKDPELKSRFAISFYDYWMLEKPELNPFFNFCYAAVATGVQFETAFGVYKTDPHSEWLAESIETLQRFPLDRIGWPHDNSERIDLLYLHPANQGFDMSSLKNNGYRVNGKVIPVDEAYFNHYNYNPWRLRTGNSGSNLGDGTVFLLPYYMGLWHGFIVE